MIAEIIQAFASPFVLAKSCHITCTMYSEAVLWTSHPWCAEPCIPYHVSCTIYSTLYNLCLYVCLYLIPPPLPATVWHRASTLYLLTHLLSTTCLLPAVLNSSLSTLDFLSSAFNPLASTNYPTTSTHYPLAPAAYHLPEIRYSLHI